MMSQKHLHELLREDQEPFHLKDYISNRKSQLNNSTKTPPVPKTRKNTPSNCFFSIQYSPDPRKSPLKFNKSPIRLHVPAKTAALLFEAAVKIKTQPSKKPRSQIRNLGFNLFGSIFKKLGAKNRTGKREIENHVGGSEVSFNKRGCSAISSSTDSGLWNESNNDKSMDLETSSSFEFMECQEIMECEKQFCSSPMSPFRFALQHCPSPGCRTPVLLSPITSPGRRTLQEDENSKSEEEEEKEQFSPVSVLDPPFEDDDGHEDGDDADIYDIESGYKFVQRARQQLLHKLRRFEKLAELDPIELEKRMTEEDDDEELDDEYEEDVNSIFSQEENEVNGFLDNILCQANISGDMKKLVIDLIKEESQEGSNNDMGKMVRRRLDSWKEVQSNTIDMMVEIDFRGETEEWKGNGKHELEKVASEIEASMFVMLVEELSEELFSLPRAY